MKPKIQYILIFAVLAVLAIITLHQAGLMSISALDECTHDDGTNVYTISCNVAKSSIQKNNEMHLTGSDNPFQRLGYTKDMFTSMDCYTEMLDGETIPGMVIWQSDNTVYCALDTPGGDYFKSRSSHLTTVFHFYKSETSSTTTTIIDSNEPPASDDGGDGNTGYNRLAWFWRFWNWLMSLLKI
ncbi:MAG: hypothetical protein DRP42_03285 [Tenericutes bacterium]|nr:MAG: hypothetical protein DRP42_03285 [Mycoplasmatota bacterium]